MFGIGSTELVVILLVGLIVLGPKSLANLSRTIGKMVGEFRRVSTDFQRTLNAEAAAEEEKEKAAKRSEEERAEAEKRAAEDRERSARLAARKEEALARARAAKEAKAQQEQEAQKDVGETVQGEPVAAPQKPQEHVAMANTDTEKAPETSVTPPAPPKDSPLARALEKTHAEAEAVQKTPAPSTETPAHTA